jgi:hypothetical protein
MLIDYLRELWKFVLLYFVRPLALFFGALVGSFYNVFFGWWLATLVRRGPQRELERDVLAQHAWLFEKYGAKLVAETKHRKQVFDYAEIKLSVGPLLLGFVRGRGESHINVAPRHAPRDWYDFGEAIDLACNRTPGSHVEIDAANFQGEFETYFELLKAFFDERSYGPARRDLRRLVRL